MASAVEIGIELGGTGAGIDGVVAQLENLKKSSEGAAKTLRDGFAAEALVGGLGRIGGAFGGITKQATDAASAIIQGFLAGGPVGAALGGVSVLVAEVAKEFERQEAAAKAAAEARAKAAAAELKALNDVNEKLREQRGLRATEEQIRSLGGSGDEAASAAALDAANEAIRRAERSLREASAAEDRLRRERDNARRLAAMGGPGERFAVEREQEVVPLLDAASRDRVSALAELERTQRAREALTEEFRRKDSAASEQARREEAAKAAADADRARDQQRAKAAAEEARLAALREQAVWQGVNDRLAAEERFQAEKAAIEERQEKRREDRAREARRKAEDAARDAARRAAEWEAAEAERIASARLAEERRLADEIARLDAESAQWEFDQEQARSELLRTNAMDTATALLGMTEALVTGQQEFTQVALQEQAKQAAVRAAFATAEGLLALAINPPGAAAAFAAAAKFAAIAVGTGVASAVAPNAPAPRRESSQSFAGTPTSGSSRSSGGSRGGGVTLVLQAQNNMLLTREELSRDVRRLLDANARRA